LGGAAGATIAVAAGAPLGLAPSVHSTGPKMDITKIPTGENPPFDVNVVIEIPLGGNPVKYELEKESGAMFVDRFLHTAMYYPFNYGFIPHTLSDDGDPVDAAVVSQIPVAPGSIIRSRPIGVLLMEDESGIDEKIVCVPVDDLHPYFKNIGSYRDLPSILIEQIAHFFGHYKDLEEGKWVEVKRWGEAEEATQLIRDGVDRARNGSPPIPTYGGGSGREATPALAGAPPHPGRLGPLVVDPSGGGGETGSRD
jgi:inorganic pyrophosphatase